MMKDWEGREVTEPEDPDKEIFVWQIEPHPNPMYDVAWVRGYQQAQKVAAESLEYLLDGRSPEELMQGVQVKMRLRRMRLREYLEVVDESC